MRWTLAQTFNTILVSSIVTSVAGSPIPIKDDSVDLERREPAKQRPRPAALKLPVRKAPAPARVNKVRFLVIFYLRRLLYVPLSAPLPALLLPLVLVPLLLLVLAPL